MPSLTIFLNLKQWTVLNVIMKLFSFGLTQGFSTAGSQPGNGSWEILSWPPNWLLERT